MSTPNVPPLPQGYSLDESTVPPLPQGYSLAPTSGTAAPTPAAPTAAAPSLWQRIVHPASSGFANSNRTGEMPSATPDENNSVLRGAEKEVARSAGGVSQLVGGPGATAQETAKHGAGEAAGGLIENVLEFMAGDQAFQSLSVADKLKEAHTLADLVKKNPVLARVLGNALKNFSIGTAQGVAKGSSASHAAEQGAGTALAGVAAEAGGSAGIRTVQSVEPTTATIGGEVIPKLRSQEANAPGLAANVASITTEPKYRAAQQEAGKRVIRNTAQEATRTALKPFAQAATEGEPELETLRRGGSGDEADAAVKQQAQAAAAQSHEAITGKPAPAGEPVKPKPSADVETHASNVRNFHDAAEQVRQGVKPQFQYLDEMTDGEFNRYRGEQKSAQRTMAANPYGSDGYMQAEAKAMEAENGLNKLFESNKDKIDKADWDAARKAWRQSIVLDHLHNAIEGSFNGVPENVAERAGVQRGMSGDRMQAKLGTLLKKIPQAEIEGVIGKDGFDNLHRIAELTSTPKRQREFGKAIEDVAGEFVRKRGLVGETLDEARRMVLHSVATNPRAGKMVVDAINIGANPKVYAPLVASAIREAQGNK